MIRKSIILFFTALVPIVAIADVPNWQIVPDKSTISFTAIQNNAPVSGSFSSFTGDIQFDPNQLATSKVSITVDMNSVTASYADVATNLKTPDWFDVKLFPQAVFTAAKFTKTENNSYQADGTLTIKGKTVPITLSFVMEEYSQTQAKAKGSATIKRTAFGIGQGEWAKTDTIKDEVKVEFTLLANRK